MKNFLKMFFALLCCFGLTTAAIAEEYIGQEATVTQEENVAQEDNVKQEETARQEYNLANPLERVTAVGQNLLQKNEIPVQISFDILETDDINAFATTDKEVYVLTGLLDFVDNDEELAAVISHEVGHIINSHTTKQNSINTVINTGLSAANLDKNTQKGAQFGQKVVMTKLSRTDEYEADITGVDLLYYAGYNPLAMVSLLYKISNGNQIDILSTHPSGDKRTMYVYDYILYSYPDIVKGGYPTDSYNTFVKYAAPIVETRNASEVELSAFNEEQAELRQKRMEKLEGYKTASQNSGWDTTYKVMSKASKLYESKLKDKLK